MSSRSISADDFRAWVKSQPGQVILDGGLASMLEVAGINITGSLWSFRAVLDNPEAVDDNACAFLAAGADIISTATYQASQDALLSTLVSLDDASAVLQNAVTRTCNVRDNAVSKFENCTPAISTRLPRRRPLVAISLGPWGAAQADGSEYTGNYSTDDASIASIEHFHERRAQILLSTRRHQQVKPDIIAFETIPVIFEAKIVTTMMMGSTLQPVPFWISFQCRDSEHIASGEKLTDAVNAVLESASASPRLVAIGVNCVSPDLLPTLVSIVRRAIDNHVHTIPPFLYRTPEILIVAYPNSGEIWAIQDAQWVWPSGQKPVSTTEWANAVISSGADIVGGCCRTLDSHIAALARVRDQRHPRPRD
jgi:homocysteine S-methyltransferase